MTAARLHQIHQDLAQLSAQAKAAIHDIRGRIEDLHAERRRIEHMPDSLATIKARIDAAIEAAAGEVEFFRPRGIELGGKTEPIDSIFDRKFAIRPFAALACLMPEKLSELLLTGMPKDGMAPDQKAVKLDDIKRQLLSAEIAEELACREMDELLSGHFPRRAEANPAILLAPTSELR